MRTKPLKKIKSLGDLSSQIFSKLTCNGLSMQNFLLPWPQIVGKEYANLCMPYKLVISKANGKTSLLLVSENRNFIANFSYYKDTINNRIKSYFGFQDDTFGGIKLARNF